MIVFPLRSEPEMVPKINDHPGLGAGARARGWGSGSGLGLGARAGPLCAFILLEKYISNVAFICSVNIYI